MKNFYQKTCPQYLKSSFFRRGFSLVEALIVIAILGIIFAIALPSFSEIKNSQVLKNASGDIISYINSTQTETRASKDSSSYGVHFQSDKIIIFKGTIFSANDANNQDIEIVRPATISNISLTGGATDFYFNRLTGLPSATGSVTVSITGNQSMAKTITISSTGTLSVN